MSQIRVFGGLFVLSVVACSAPAPAPTPVAGAEEPLMTEACACRLDEVCSVDAQCVARPVVAPGERFGSVTLLEQVVPAQPDALRDIGTANASFHDYEPLPEDERTTVPVASGGACAIEQNTTYPSNYGGQFWPSGPGLGVGDLSFDVAGTNVPIRLNAAAIGAYGWTYVHRDEPPALEEPGAHYPQFFDPSVLRPGATFGVEAAGGPDVGANALQGELPRAFTITEPPAESPGATASVANGLHVAWSPAQRPAYMEIFLTRGTGSAGSFILVSCKIPDNGSTTIPTSALAPLTNVGPIGIQLRRTTERYAKVVSATGPLHLAVFGRHARIGSVSLKRH